MRAFGLRKVRFGSRAGAGNGVQSCFRRRLERRGGAFARRRERRAAAFVVEVGEATEVYEYSVLVTSLDETTEAFGQLDRDRGDGENIFDEMKNQWGWGGFHDARSSRPLPARGAARRAALRLVEHLIFRLADPDLHREAITSRPLFLSAIATRTGATRGKRPSA